MSEDGKSRVSKARQYIDALASDKTKLSPPEGTKPISAFWSYGIEHPKAPENDWGVPFLSQRFMAEEWAAQQNVTDTGTAQTLETTEGGSELDGMFLWEPKVIKALGGARAGFGPGYAKAKWDEISATYGGLAEGRVVVFADIGNTRAVLHQKELGTLCGNENVGLHNIDFVYEAPSHGPTRPGPRPERTPCGPSRSSTTRTSPATSTRTPSRPRPPRPARRRSTI